MSEVGISNGPSKSSRKKNNEKEATAASIVATEPAPPNTGVQDGSESGSKLNGDAAYESPYIKDLQRNIRNITKKLNATQRVDAIQAENPGVSLDDLVASRKINNDQKAQALKKPSLEAQQAQLEEQIATYKKVELDVQAHAAEEKTRLEQAHQKELEALRTTLEDAKVQAAVATRAHLLTISNFLRAAAARRQMEDDTSEDSRAFEGLLLLLYGGDVAAVDAAEKLINGSSDSVMSTEGTSTTVSYGRVRQLAAEIAPSEDDEAPPAKTTDVLVNGDAANIVHTDPTIAHAGLTEQTEVPISNEPEVTTGPEQADIGEGAANAAATRNWDSSAAMGGSDSMGESWISVPRPADETEKAPTATLQNDISNWTSGDGGQNGYDATAVEVMAATADSAAAVDIANVPQASSWAEDSQDDYEQSAAKAAADDGYQPVPVKKHKPRGGAGGDARGGAGGGRGGGRGGNRGRGGERGGPRGGQRGGQRQGRGNRPRES